MKGSCDIPNVIPETASKASDVNTLPAEKLEAMKNYAKELHKKHPKMKEQRIMHKVAEKFKIKLV